MKIIHLSAECYPAAKVGGLADVVGSLPKYLEEEGATSSVLMPKYNTEWIRDKEFETVFEAKVEMLYPSVSFRIQKESKDALGFPLYMVDIPSYFVRPGIYGDPGSKWGYGDEAERFIAFQRAALKWIQSLNTPPDIVHCHDHHTGLVPFMMTQCYMFESLKSIPTVLTVHNAQYQGIHSHGKQTLLPDFNRVKAGLLDWDGKLNSLATGLRCCWQISTVSPSYMEELRYDNNGLDAIFTYEAEKSRGILNGIDEQVWNPKTDSYLEHQFSLGSIVRGKAQNKAELCEQFDLDKDRPLIAFIGRLVGEKGADLLPDLFKTILHQTSDVSFVVLGTGRPGLQKEFRRMSDNYVGYFDASLNYNEKLAHQIYAGSDFMIIPSRVEPCGLNQMYAMHYGTIPIVRAIGGLKDTVQDISHADGHGIMFTNFNLQEGVGAVKRALALYRDIEKFRSISRQNMTLDFSWNVSAKKYIKMYNQLIY